MKIESGFTYEVNLYASSRFRALAGPFLFLFMR